MGFGGSSSVIGRGIPSPHKQLEDVNTRRGTLYFFAMSAKLRVPSTLEVHKSFSSISPCARIAAIWRIPSNECSEKIRSRSARSRISPWIETRFGCFASSGNKSRFTHRYPSSSRRCFNKPPKKPDPPVSKTVFIVNYTQFTMRKDARRGSSKLSSGSWGEKHSTSVSHDFPGMRPGAGDLPALGGALCNRRGWHGLRRCSPRMASRRLAACAQPLLESAVYLADGWRFGHLPSVDAVGAASHPCSRSI